MSTGTTAAPAAVSERHVLPEARAGLGVIVSSSDECDLLGMCTRVLVLRRGVIATELTGEEITEPNLLHAMEGSD